MIPESTKEKAKLIWSALEEHKAHDMTMIDISDISIMADLFIIVSADNVRQVGALSDAAEEAMAKGGFDMRGKEGTDVSGWILLDYNDVIVHIFDKEMRIFYDLERIWSDGKKILEP